MKKITITVEMTEQQFEELVTLAVLADLIADKCVDYNLKHTCKVEDL